MAPLPSDANSCHMVDNNINNDDNLSVIEFKGSEEKLRGKLLSDEISRNQHPGWCPAWMLTTYDESTTKVNTIDDELKRLKTLERFRILDDEPYDEAIVGLTTMAATLFGVSVALVDLVDLGRLKVVANHGLGPDLKFLPRKDSFCSHAIQCVDQVCVVPDAAEDDRFRKHWIVTGKSPMRFYAAAALVVDNYKIGIFCILDNKPWNQGLSTEQKQLLVHLAATTSRILVDRRDRLETQDRMERAMASFSHGIMTPLNGLTLALAALRETDQPKNLEGEKQRDSDSSASGVFTVEQRELLSTASCCADALVNVHKMNQDSMFGLLTPKTKDSAVHIRSRNLSEIVSCLFETLAPIAKQVPVFMEIDSAVPETTIFSRTQDLTVFRVAMMLLSTACARTLRGFIVLKVLRQRNGPGKGEDADRIVFECHDCGPHLSDDDAAEFQQQKHTHNDRPMCTDAIHHHRSQHIIHDSSLQGLLFGLQSVEPIHGCYGYRKRVTAAGCNNIDSPHDHRNSNNNNVSTQQEGSVFWFSFPFPHLMQSCSSMAPLVVPPPAASSRSKVKEEREGYSTTMSMMKQTAEISIDGGKKRNLTLSSSPLVAGPACSGANDQAMAHSTATKMTKLISPKLLQAPNDAGTPLKRQQQQQVLLRSNDDVDKHGAAPLAPRKKQALIIDDALIIRKTLARVLNQMGYEVSLAVDGQDGCEKLKESRYDLVLCDFLMPIMDGADCVRQYRTWECEHRPGFRQFIMGMSGHASSLDAEQAIASGMDGFYAKPLTRKILDSMLQTEAAYEAAAILDRYYCAESTMSSTWDLKGDTNDSMANAVAPYSSSSLLEKSIEMNEFDCSISSLDMGLSSRVVCSKTGPGMKVGKIRHCLLATKVKITDSFVLAMKCHGWQICIAESCSEALNLMKERNWDAVVIGDSLCFSSSSETSLFGLMDNIHNNWCAAQYVAEFRNWETSNRFNRQRNVFLHCSYWAAEVGNDHDSMMGAGGSSASVLIQPPPGFDGALNMDMQWEDFHRLVTTQQQNCAEQDMRYDLFFVKRRRNIGSNNVMCTN